MEDLKIVSDEEAAICAQLFPDTFLKITKKEAKKGATTTYADNNFNINGKKMVWFAGKDTPLSRGVADPKDSDDPRNKYAKGSSSGFSPLRSNLQVTVEGAGNTGTFLNCVHDVFTKTMAEKAQEFGVGKRDIHDIVKRGYTKDGEWKESAGGGEISLKVKWGKFPDTFPIKSKAGQPEVVFEDYDQPLPLEEGKPQRYAPALVPDADGNMVPINESNFHLLCNSGAILKEYVYSLSSDAFSQSWVSAQLLIHRAVVQRGSNQGNDTVVLPPNMDALREQLRLKLNGGANTAASTASTASTVSTTDTTTTVTETQQSAEDLLAAVVSGLGI